MTLSFGEARVFRLTHPGSKLTHDFPAPDGTVFGKLTHDFPAPDGTVFVMPYDTNRAWRHAVPKFARHRGRRLSITLCAFGWQGESRIELA